MWFCQFETGINSQLNNGGGGTNYFQKLLIHLGVLFLWNINAFKGETLVFGYFTHDFILLEPQTSYLRQIRPNKHTHKIVICPFAQESFRLFMYSLICFMYMHIFYNRDIIFFVFSYCNSVLFGVLFFKYRLQLQ